MHSAEPVACYLATMFLRAKTRKNDGKIHRYFSVVENRSVGGKRRTVQRTALHLGEINGGQEAAWRQALEVFDEGREEHRTLSLFADDAVAQPASVDNLRVRLSEMELRRARSFGDCWLGCELWRQLDLEKFWQQRLEENVRRETVDWEKVLRLLDPGSEFRVHRQWFDRSAMGGNCWERILQSRRRTVCIAVWTGSWSTSRSCSRISDSAGRICSALSSMCCFMT